MRIISWNINGLRSAIAKDALVPIAALEPDILCLQEIRTTDQPTVLPGHHHTFNPAQKPGYAGTALISAPAPCAVWCQAPHGASAPADLNAEGRVIAAEFPAFHLVTAYVPRSLEGLRRRDYRARFDDALLDLIDDLEREKPTIICGDFNAILDADDIYAENAHAGELEGFATEDRDLLLALQDAGFLDAFRHAHPHARDAYTWWSPRRNRRAVNRGWRLDYFFVSPALAGRIADARHLADIPGSDHCPILLDLA